MSKIKIMITSRKMITSKIKSKSKMIS